MSRHDVEQMTDGQREIFLSGVETERKRIIKLLEEQSFTTLHDEVGVSERLDVLIALIKGENK